MKLHLFFPIAGILYAKTCLAQNCPDPSQAATIVDALLCAEQNCPNASGCSSPDSDFVTTDLEAVVCPFVNCCEACREVSLEAYTCLFEGSGLCGSGAASGCDIECSPDRFPIGGTDTASTMTPTASPNGSTPTLETPTMTETPTISVLSGGASEACGAAIVPYTNCIVANIFVCSSCALGGGLPSFTEDELVNLPEVVCEGVKCCDPCLDEAREYFGKCLEGNIDVACEGTVVPPSGNGGGSNACVVESSAYQGCVLQEGFDSACTSCLAGLGSEGFNSATTDCAASEDIYSKTKSCCPNCVSQLDKLVNCEFTVGEAKDAACSFATGLSTTSSAFSTKFMSVITGMTISFFPFCQGV